MPRSGFIVVTLAVLAVVGGCRSGSAYRPAPSPARARPTPPPLYSGALALRVAYPPTDGTQAAASQSLSLSPVDDYKMPGVDSTFVFGTAGTGDARVTVNGQEVAVYPTGGWIAWLAIPNDTVVEFEIVGTSRGETARLTLHVPRVQAFIPPDSNVWIDTTSLSPRGDRWTRADEGVRLSLKAAREAEVRVLMSDGRIVPFLSRHAPADVPWGERAFGTTATPERFQTDQADLYELWWQGPFGPRPGNVLFPDSLPPDDDSLWIWVEAVRGADTARVRWPLRLDVIDTKPLPAVVVDDDTAETELTDKTLAGRPLPYGTYHWFFPNGTRAAVNGRWNNQVRLQLSRNTVAWVDASDVLPLRSGTPPLIGAASSIRLTPTDGALLLRIPLPGRIPFRIDEGERQVRLRLYGVQANMDWIQYGGTDPLVRLLSFAQPREDETDVIVDLTQPVWGYRTRWEGDDLLLEIRRPPPIDRAQPLRGRVIAIDPGHPPGGSTGPTGLKEPDAVLAVAQKTAELLARFGARAVLTRDSEAPLGLTERVQAAEVVGADVLVSIHANALPDGVNPFVNNGTSVYYFHPRSALLARELNRALVRHFGFRDLGMGRGDLALARPTWMPSALTEGLFMMIPEQEAVLLDDEGQWRYAWGVVEGLASFLRIRAMENGSM